MGRTQTYILPRASCSRMLATNKNRVSDAASEVLVALLEKHAATIGAKSVKNALHAGRKTVQAQDVQLAEKQ